MRTARGRLIDARCVCLCASAVRPCAVLSVVDQSLSLDAPVRCSLEARLTAVVDELSSLRRDLAAVSARLSRYEFTYSAPSASFDRSRVCGSVLSNLSVPVEGDCRAVETSAAGRLSNIIVDSEQTGRQLLESTGLKQRVTLIPLNRISQQSSIQPVVAERACSLVGRDNARVAVDCVSFDRKVEPAMRFVFGSTFVCPDVQTASQLAFNATIARRAVTLDGDVVDPHGTMEGGASAQQQAGQLSLVQLQHKRVSLDECISRLQAEQAELIESLSAVHAKAQQAATWQAELEAAEHSLSLLRVELQLSTYSACESDIGEWTVQLHKRHAEAEAAESEQRRLSEQCASLEREIAECETERGREEASAALRKRMASLQAEIASVGQQVSAAQRQQMTAQAWLTQLRDDIQRAEAETKAGGQQLAQLDAQLQSEQRRVQDSSGSYDAAKVRLAAVQEALQQSSRLLQQAQKAKQRLAAQRKECELELRRLQAAGSKVETELTDGRRRVERLQKEHQWIAAQRHLFGQPGGDFDFAPFAAVGSSSSSAYSRLQDEVAALGRRVNRKAGSQVDKAESEYAALSDKRAIVEADKLKIGQVIDELELKKQQAVASTWQQVNRDFGRIMLALLPGVTAQLRPVGVSDATAVAATSSSSSSTAAAELSRLVSAGVEMRVAFGGVWKESLSELSGGQRSLLALSFILALLLFKPAPIYILDEIDAALDLSHTQNIGAMIRQHFPHSQFVVVSLKEGLFAHANTLFRTSFVNGVSTVAVQRHYHSLAHNNTKQASGAHSNNTDQQRLRLARDGKGRNRQLVDELDKENSSM